MRFSLACAALLPVLAAADNILVQVGAGGKLAFSPTNITANAGDVIAFQFQGKNHSVTQSTFGSPCTIQTTPAQGIDSDFQPVPANATSLPQWSFTVTNASAPLWFFCKQTNPANHCQAGMVFSVNANPNSEKSYAAFQALAMGNAAAAAGGAASTVASAAGAAASDAGAAAAGAASAAGSVIAGAGGAVATDAAGVANALTSGLSAAIPLPTGGGNSTNAAFHLGSSPVVLLAAVGLGAGLLL